ncbi:tetratricopeptide repeat protein [Amycolatopsis sp. YIM 10]|uniref:tetratricopeptide repeat protein n=1 Tax=Amycolatopsis sp. YIM 10 TaxID=2653857 RepID=UPI00129035A4|nr:tetratricopeptide repeat protein [Amycolatopsis sp. YIM 10]QFU86708.1 Regulatory protein AfsR [Amycolatopsis sp. YIM 10]
MRTINAFAAAVERLRLREPRKLSLAEVAQASDVSASYLSKLLHGHRRLVPDVVQRIDDTLHAGGELVRIANEQRETSTPPRPMQLPPGPASWIGRSEELHALDTALIPHDTSTGSPTTIVVEGGPWTGKTALVLHWTARVQRRFPGGCLFADLRGLAAGQPVAPEDILDVFLRALGATHRDCAQPVADKISHYRSLLAAQPALIVLDNVADYDQVRDLLPGGGSVTVLTSREHQASLVLHTGATVLQVPPLAHDDAQLLLAQRLGHARIAADPAATDRIIRGCANLPAALLIAAERLTRNQFTTLTGLANALETDALDTLSSSDPALNAHHALAVSYLALPGPARRILRLLGSSPVHHTSPEATAAYADIDLPAAGNALRTLREAHLLEDAPSGRLRINAVVRAYAAYRGALEEPPAQLDLARERLLAWYADTAWAASDALAPGWAGRRSAVTSGARTEIDAGFNPGSALAWLEAEVPAALDLARQAQRGLTGDAGWHVPAAMLPYAYLTKHHSAWLALATEGLRAAQTLNSTPGIAVSALSLGLALSDLGHLDDGLRHLTTAAQHYARAGDNLGSAWASIALTAHHHSARPLDDPRRAYQCAEAVFAHNGAAVGVVVAQILLAGAHQDRGDGARAHAIAQQAVRAASELESQPLSMLARHRLGRILTAQGRHHAALAVIDAAPLPQAPVSATTWPAVEMLTARGDTLAAMHENRAAGDAYQQAADLLAATSDPSEMRVRAQAITFKTLIA